MGILTLSEGLLGSMMCGLKSVIKAIVHERMHRIDLHNSCYLTK